MRKITLTAICALASLCAMSQDNDRRLNQYGQEVNRQALQAEERDGILTFESKNQNYKFWLDNRVQVDAAVFFGDGKKLNPIGNGIAFRRVRFAAKAQINKYWYGEVDMQLANGAFELEDAYMKYMPFSFIDFKLGNFKENFSMENTTTSRYLTFIERPMVISAMAPSRHIGFQTNYEHHYFLASGGIFFQEIKDLEINTIVEDNNKDYGFNQGMSYTFRFVGQPYVTQEKGIQVTYSTSYRTPKTDVAVGKDNIVRYSTRANTSINRKKYIDTDNIADVDNEWMNGFELAGYWGPVRFQSEYIMNQITRSADKTKLKFNGGYVQAAVLLFGGKQQYDKSAGEFTQPSRGRNWGDVELAVRYDYLNMNSKDVKGGAGEGVTFGANYYISSNVKVMLNYNIINNDRYANGKGKLNVGYDAAGNLTKNPDQVVGGKGKAGNDFNFMSIRFEIDF